MAAPAEPERGGTADCGAGRRLRDGNVGEWRSLGEGVSELKIDFGPGYRLYFTRRGEDIILLLCGGDKRTQTKDIARARRLAQTYGAEAEQ